MPNHMVDKVIEYAEDNTAGTVLDRDAVAKVLRKILLSGCKDPEQIDIWLDECQTAAGYLLKASSFTQVVDDYI